MFFKSTGGAEYPLDPQSLEAVATKIKKDAKIERMLSPNPNSFLHVLPFLQRPANLEEMDTGVKLQEATHPRLSPQNKRLFRMIALEEEDGKNRPSSP